MEIIPLNTRTAAQDLRYAVRELNCNYHSIQKPTSWPTDSQKIPDLFDFFTFSKVATNFIDVEENLELNSDYSVVMLTLSEIFQVPPVKNQIDSGRGTINKKPKHSQTILKTYLSLM